VNGPAHPGGAAVYRIRPTPHRLDRTLRTHHLKEAPTTVASPSRRRTPRPARRTAGVPRQRPTPRPTRKTREPLLIPTSLRNAASYLHGWAWIAAGVTAGTILILWTEYVIAACVAALIAASWWDRHHAPLRPRTPAAGGLAQYRAMAPTAFEDAIAALARRSPDVARATRAGGSNDRALDVLVQLRDGRRILIQCKRYTGNVGAPALYQVNGTYRSTHRCQMAVVVTTAGFTRSALEWNASLPRAERLRLVDGPALMAWARGGPPPWA